MGSDDLKPGIFRFESLSDGKGNDRCEISGEEVFLSCLQLPVLNFLQLGETMVLEVTGEPLDCVIGGDCVVDEGDERLRKVAATRE